MYINYVRDIVCIYCVGLISEHKHPIVTMQFLNEWGDRQVVPYRIAHNSSVRVDGKNDTCTVYVCYHWYIYMQCIYMYIHVHVCSYGFIHVYCEGYM